MCFIEFRHSSRTLTIEKKKKNETNQLNCQLLLSLSKIKYLIQNTNTDIEILNTNDE